MCLHISPLYHYQTRQLNIWGFVRTETLGGEKNGWKHKFFLKGRPDLLKDIERTEVKNGARKRSSVTKPKHSSRSTKKTAQRRKEVAVVADESSCSSSRADSQASLSSYKSDNAHDHSANGSTVPSSGLGVRNVPHGSALNDSDCLPISFVRYEEESYSQHPPIQGSPSFSSFSMQGCNDDTTTQVSNTEETVAMYSDDQPFNNEDLMYLASIFEKDERRSHDDDLSSILSLHQETSLEDYISNL